jgi:energy-coupling factor transport system substrate-specific component
MSKRPPLHYSFVGLCIGLNVSCSFIAQTFKLPVFLDSIGMILCAVMVGPAWGAVSGIAGLGILSVLIAPFEIAYSFTAVTIAFSAYLFHRIGYMQTWPRTILLAPLVGVVAAISSAPVTTYLFGGVSLAGTDAVTAFFSATGRVLAHSVLFGGLATDPFDKLLQSIAAFSLLRVIPEHVRYHFPDLRS